MPKTPRWNAAIARLPEGYPAPPGLRWLSGRRCCCCCCFGACAPCPKGCCCGRPSGWACWRWSCCAWTRMCVTRPAASTGMSGADTASADAPPPPPPPRAPPPTHPPVKRGGDPGRRRPGTHEPPGVEAPWDGVLAPRQGVGAGVRGTSGLSGTRPTCCPPATASAADRPNRCRQRAKAFSEGALSVLLPAVDRSRASISNARETHTAGGA